MIIAVLNVKSADFSSFAFEGAWTLRGSAARAGSPCQDHSPGKDKSLATSLPVFGIQSVNRHLMNGVSYLMILWMRSAFNFARGKWTVLVGLQQDAARMNDGRCTFCKIILQRNDASLRYPSSIPDEP